MSKFGFSKKSPDTMAIELPKAVKPGKKPGKDKIAKAVAAGEELGFISREGQEAKKPGRKRSREPQGKILITGPERVMENFRTYCDQNEVTYWVGLEALLKKVS